MPLQGGRHLWIASSRTRVAGDVKHVRYLQAPMHAVAAMVGRKPRLRACRLTAYIEPTPRA
jgi:hypothetical protein